MPRCYWCCINDPMPPNEVGLCADCSTARTVRDSAAVTLAMRVANRRRAELPLDNDTNVAASIVAFEQADTAWGERCSSKSLSAPAKPGEVPF